ncbi:MAG: FtsW/RodA/SpoVE family cell cycle protein [Prevotella sp.]|nr:FtsW/RodA/SpoVE family cell cycle protein [Prevotella sp.]
MNKKLGNLFKGDKGIWMVFFFLCLISIIEVFSASSTLSYKSQNFMGPIIYHAGTLFFGILLTIVVLNIPCRYFKLMTPVLLILSFATLLWVLFFGESINGANRVIQLPGFTFQPSELAKGTMVLATAQILSAMQRDDGSGADSKAMKYILWLVLPAIMLIGVENLSTAVLLFGVIFVMMFVGRVPMVQIGKLTGGLVLVIGIFLTLVLTLGSMDSDEEEKATTTELVVGESPQADEEDEGVVAKIFHRFGTWRNRLLNHNSRPDDPNKYSVRDNFQVAHSNFAIVTSGIVGKGPGNSEERDYLPQAFSDFIFSIIIEEMGLIGAIVVVFLYIILLIRSARIASRCENNFPAFLVMGLAVLLVAQAAINMMVAVGIGPVTGQPLPLVSKGGTSTLVSCVYIGAILSVSRSAKRKDGTNVSTVSTEAI